MAKSHAFDEHTTGELLSMLLGKRLNAGVDREVYVCAYDPRLVVKVCIGEWDWQNVAEFTLWSWAMPDLEKWLAPVIRISRDGKVLLMARCEPCPKHLLPSKVPDIIAEDLHAGNVGLYEGRPVCLDYGRHIAGKMVANAKRLVVPEKLDTSSQRRSW